MKKDHKISEGALFTDFYQLTMAQLYFHMNMHEKQVQFDYFFRNYPDYGKHKAGYCVNAGLEWLLSWMKNTRFGKKEIKYLKKEKSRSGKRLFSDSFLKWLEKNGNFKHINLQAIPEGRVIHPHIPIVTAWGPFAMSQILESSLLNHLNYQILIATKACRIHEAGRQKTMIDFGMRRAQDKGANAGARAALIGGADFSSNAGISYFLGYRPKGTHAHSMVQAFMALGHGELGAFRAYADVYPDDCLLLVDTINTLESGIPNAIKVFEKLKKKGHKPLGIRLDSGDLAYLSIQAAKMLNSAGFPDTRIVLSNQLDELVIWQIINQIKNESSRYGVEADTLINRLVYGVGTHLITSKGDAALDGIYKLTAIRKAKRWIPAIKLSESVSKIINPGHKKAWRVYDKRDKAIADLLSTDDEDPRKKNIIRLRHPFDAETHKTLKKSDIREVEPLLMDILKDGKLVCESPAIEKMRNSRQKDINRLDAGVKRLINPHVYHVSLTQKLWDLKQKLIKEEQKGG